MVADRIWGPTSLTTFALTLSEGRRGWHFIVSDADTTGRPVMVDRQVRGTDGNILSQLTALILLEDQTLHDFLCSNFDDTWATPSVLRQIWVNQGPITQEQVTQWMEIPPGATITIFHESRGVSPLQDAAELPDSESDVSSFGQMGIVRHLKRPPVWQWRPNVDITLDFDDFIPLPDGGRVIPPPNWNEQPLLRFAADNDAVVRDQQQFLIVECRTWFFCVMDTEDILDLETCRSGLNY